MRLELIKQKKQAIKNLEEAFSKENIIMRTYYLIKYENKLNKYFDEISEDDR